MAGGRHVNVPCSHAAHMEVKGQRDYRIGNMRNVAKNHIRYVEALFDPVYKETFYYYNPYWKVLAMVTQHVSTLMLNYHASEKDRTGSRDRLAAGSRSCTLNKLSHNSKQIYPKISFWPILQLKLSGEGLKLSFQR